MSSFSTCVPAVILLFILPSFAQTGTITGRITDRTGTFMVGANVTVLDSAVEPLPDSAYERHIVTRQSTGSDGRYAATGLKQGNYILRVTAIGCCTQNLPVIVKANREAKVDVKLTAGGIHVNENVASLPQKQDVYHEPSKVAPGKSLILGTVRDAETRHPIAFAYITVGYEYRNYADKECFDTVEGCCYSAYADSVGRFGLSNLSPGVYRLSYSVSDSSYARGYREITTLPDSLHRVDFLLTKNTNAK